VRLLDWVITTAGQYPLVGGVVAAILVLFPFVIREELKR